MERRRWLASLAGMAAVLILVAVALAAATRALGAPAASDATLSPLIADLVPRAPLGRLADDLRLSAEQRQSIRGLIDAARPTFAQLERELRAAAELLAKTPPDDPAYPSVVATVRQATAELAAEAVLEASALRSRIHGVLSAEQRSRLIVLEADLDARDELRRDHAVRAFPVSETAAGGAQ